MCLSYPNSMARVEIDGKDSEKFYRDMKRRDMHNNAQFKDDGEVGLLPKYYCSNYPM